MSSRTQRSENRPSEAGPLRLALCCQFAEQPIKFRTTTVTWLQRQERATQLDRLSELCLSNARALLESLEYCLQVGIGGFRVNSQICPAKTHPQVGYDLTALPGADQIIDTFRSCGTFARRHHIRLSFHPDQFVVLNSPREEVVERSLAELQYQAEIAELIGADVINIHAGGAYGDKAAARKLLAENISRASAAVRSRLTLENDDTTYTPSDLLPVCLANGIPLVYDVHHHRCHRDQLSIEEATELALTTWNREPLFHLSSPLGGWNGPRPKLHHDYIDPADFPDCWHQIAMTVEVEAKAKELAVLRLKNDLHLLRREQCVS